MIFAHLMVGFILLLLMQINIGDIIISSSNVVGIVADIESDYVFIYWNDGVNNDISVATLEFFIARKNWQHHAN